MSLSSKYDFEKKYNVYFEKSALLIDGYKYCKPQYAPISSDKNNFYLVFHFKKPIKNINTLLIIDSMDGDDFPEKIAIINHFKRNHALSYATDVDGLGEI